MESLGTSQNYVDYSSVPSREWQYNVNINSWMARGATYPNSYVDPKDTGLEWTPLMRLCALTGKTDVATLLIDAGANVNARDKDGKTPLMIAALNNHEDLVALLLERGADPDVKNEFGKGALEMARGLNRQSVASIIEEKKRQLSSMTIHLSPSSSTHLCEASK